MGRWIRIILHGKAAGRAPVREAVKQVRSEGHRIDVRITWEGGDARRLAQEAANEGVETLVAAGGDGTVNEVAAGLTTNTASDDRPTFGILPQGTANDFARSCLIPLDPLPALRLVAQTGPVPMDIGRIEDRVLINVGTGGIGPKITVETNEDLKRILGGGAYFVTSLTKWRQFRPVRARFSGPDFDWSGAFLVLAIGNGRQAGGGNVLCPQALIDDGLLDVRILPEMPEEEHGAAVQELLAHGAQAIEKRVVTARVPWVVIESDEEHQINLDGEPLVRKHFRFEIESNALQIHLPENAPVLRRAR